MIRAIFICTGNICRSPMAHYIFEHRANERGIPNLAVSMSTLGLQGNPAAPNAIDVCAEIGVDLENHRAQPLNQAMLKAATHIFVMEPIHEEAAIRAGADPSKIIFLGSLDPENPSPVIDDPHQQSREKFVICRDRIARALDSWLDQL